ncbi:Eco57I restriction-modification methylase domain-containing protein [Sphingopyxis sp. PET50]|uniref:Eco57I restriction-modification methylase domain-containing protein n=1 Tax=Sphingopyxis sp. PET50 TaxID=2976533 RepID=UPI0021B07D74|nr:N-6 DNA methylase [Sphingopyxis sp. PET50]
MENPPYPVALRTPEQLESLFPEAAEPDISDIGENLPGSERRYGIVPGKKAEGATYTPRDLSDFVADQIIAAADIPAGRRLRVLDPALGHGELLCSLLDRLPAGVDVFAFETDPAALSVASERLTAGYPQAKLHLVEGSFLDHVLDDFSSGLFSEGESYDLVIANPPYVRTQIIGSRRAQELASQFGLSGRVDLYFAFLLGIARVLNPAGSAGIIVSNRFMTTRSGGVVREALSKVLSLRRIFDLGDTKLFDAAVLLSRHRRERAYRCGEASAPASFTAIYETKTKRADFRAESALAALPYSGVAGLPDGRVFEIRHGSLHTNQNPADVWRLCSEDVVSWLATVEANSRGQFKDIGKVRVGVKTCADKVFVRREW